MDQVMVRAAVADDLPAIIDIEVQSFSLPWKAETFSQLLDRDDVMVLVAGANGSLAGYAVVWVAADEAELANVAVAPELRGRGVGSRLVEHALEAVGARGARRIFLEVRESNSAAAGLYERLGFTEIGVRRGYYRRPVEDARVLMRSLLTQASPS